jgi:16S rRNA (uracil1498-N3)-methyltransferase
MHRFFLRPQQVSAQRITFPPDLAHQILHVLRLKDGDLVEVLVNDGFIMQAQLKLDANQNILFGNVLNRNVVSTEPRINLQLYFGLSNREKVELILQKGTEIGVSTFCPYVSSRTIVRTTSLPEKKRARWERIIREAAEQSNRGKLPILYDPIDLEDGFSQSYAVARQRVLAWAGADTQNDRLADVIQPQNGGALAVFVGPEGGFSEDEIQLVKSSDIKLVSLGSRILRMETAAIIFPTLVLYALGAL